MNSVEGMLSHRRTEFPATLVALWAAELFCRFGWSSPMLIRKQHIEARDRPHGRRSESRPKVRGPSRFSVGLPFVERISRDAHGRSGG